MYKVKSFLQLVLGDSKSSVPIADQINDFLENNPKVIPINVSHGISTTNTGLVVASYAMLLYKEEE